MSRTVLAIRHLGFEDLGVFADVLVSAGFTPRYIEAPLGLTGLDPLVDDLVVILGGPIAAWEEDRYPFLAQELNLIRARLAANRPLVGLCLGAQLIARAAGAAVYPGPGREIGYATIDVDDDGPLRDLAGIPVLHWHGDTFDLPDGAVQLASTGQYANQAFALGAALALQFHPEADPTQFERWLVGHAAELAAAGIHPADLRTQAASAGPASVDAGRAMFRRFLQGLP